MDNYAGMNVGIGTEGSGSGWCLSLEKAGRRGFFQVLFGARWASPALTRSLLLLRALGGDRGEFGGDSLDIPRFPGHLPA